MQTDFQKGPSAQSADDATKSSYQLRCPRIQKASAFSFRGLLPSSLCFILIAINQLQHVLGGATAFTTPHPRKTVGMIRSCDLPETERVITCRRSARAGTIRWAKLPGMGVGGSRPRRRRKGRPRRMTKREKENTTADQREESILHRAIHALETSRLNRAFEGSPVHRAVDTYISYAQRLWGETSPEARREVAKKDAEAAVKRVQHIVRGEEYVEGLGKGKEDKEARQKMMDACELMLAALDTAGQTHDGGERVEGVAINETASVARTPAVSSKAPDADLPEAVHAELKDNEKTVSAVSVGAANIPSSTENKKKKPRRSILFGAAMGAAVACWVFSGNYIFTALFTLMTVLGQLEYYRMIMNTGVYPARRISVLGACAMFVTALFAPELHQICLPVFACVTMVWFLTMRRQVSTIAEIATTFTGMFYLGYIPSFWVRIRLIGQGREPTRLAPILGPILEMLGKKASSLPSFIPKSVHLPITTGAIFIFWTWLCIAFADVGGYFAGRNFGKTKLGKIAPAAGATSPNKTVEGVLGSCTISALLGTVGGWVQHWPYWYVTGPVHGLYLAILGLIGDLTASMLKRDAGLKDFGDLIPEHGGIMDRVDSYIFTAPYSWLVVAYIIPALKAFSKSKAALPMV